jgi:hypothetical protein
MVDHGAPLSEREREVIRWYEREAEIQCQLVVGTHGAGRSGGRVLRRRRVVRGMPGVPRLHDPLPGPRLHAHALGGAGLVPTLQHEAADEDAVRREGATDGAALMQATDEKVGTAEVVELEELFENSEPCSGVGCVNPAQWAGYCPPPCKVRTAMCDFHKLLLERWFESGDGWAVQCRTCGHIAFTFEMLLDPFGPL